MHTVILFSITSRCASACPGPWKRRDLLLARTVLCVPCGAAVRRMRQPIAHPNTGLEGTPACLVLILHRVPSAVLPLLKAQPLVSVSLSASMPLLRCSYPFLTKAGSLYGCNRTFDSGSCSPVICSFLQRAKPVPMNDNTEVNKDQ